MSGEKLALVFSGGGARGAYQLGSWEALRENQIDQKVIAVYGTSVGAINAAAFAQGDYEKAKSIWEHLNYENVFNKLEQRHAIKKLSRSDYIKMARSIIKNRGLNVDPLKELLRNSLNEEKIRKSSIDFGLVVYNLTERKPKYLKKDDIPQGQLIEYIIASASFPLFQPHVIDDALYIDGGITDNRPLKLISDNPITKVICIDVTIARHFWKNKKTKTGEQVIYLRPSKLLGSPMAFRNERIRRNMKLGYHDGNRQIKENYKLFNF